MCGIVGIVNTQAPVDEGIILRMRDSIAHRGPDDAGLYVSPDRKVALGNRRLAIIDLSAAGHQPLCNEDGTVWITYNGEVYNFQELQCELVNKGHVFKSHTDTEVIVHGYEEWGIEELLVRLRGMFAFAILDTRERLRRHAAPRHATLHAPRLFLARDRFGIKPLYYFHDDGKLVFASEVRALRQSHLVPDETEPKAIIGFFVFGSVPTPYTTVRNVYSIPAGHYAVYGDGRFQLIKYYDVLPSDGSRDRSAPYYTGRDVTAEAGASAGRKKARADTVYEEIRQILEEDVRLHLISDAPLGVFLSGGIDSSALVALASQHRSEPLTTLSVIFEEQEFTEQAFQKMIAEQYHTVHHEVMVRGQDFWEDLPRIFEAMDQPTVDGVNTYFVSKAAKESGLKVVLSGLGGDEVFCGYESFKWIGLLRRVQALPLPLEWPLRFVRGWPRGSGHTDLQNQNDEPV